MKGDETENKKIGCTVNLMVRILCVFVFVSFQIDYYIKSFYEALRYQCKHNDMKKYTVLPLFPKMHR